MTLERRDAIKREEGREEGREEMALHTIQILKNLKIGEHEILQSLINTCKLPEEEALRYLEKSG